MRYIFVDIDARRFTYQFLGELFRWAYIIQDRSLIPVKYYGFTYLSEEKVCKFDLANFLLLKRLRLEHLRSEHLRSERNANSLLIAPSKIPNIVVS